MPSEEMFIPSVRNLFLQVSLFRNAFFGVFNSFQSFRSFIGRIEDTKETHRNQPTFRFTAISLFLCTFLYIDYTKYFSK